METTLISSAADQREQDIFKSISLTALLTATLYITAAIIQNYIETSTGPESMFKGIASGIFGKDAINGGNLMVIWGIVLHFMISFLFTAFLFLIYPKTSRFIKNKFITGILYGSFISAIMNLIVVPLSKINKFPPGTKEIFINALVIISMIGIPVALTASKYYLSIKKKID